MTYTLAPSADEIKNGWTADDIEAYRAERDRAADLVGGFVVTPFVRPKEHPKLIGAKSFNPHRW